MKIQQLWVYVKSPGAMAVVALASLIFTIYQSFEDKRPSLYIKTEAVASVFNVLQPIGGLEVFYGGNNLRATHQSLWVITVVVTNNGASSIRKSDFDDTVPFALTVNGGEIAQMPTISSDNAYLQENLKPSVRQHAVVFSPVIIEPQDTFRVRLVVLGPDGLSPSIKGSAKIVNLQRIENVAADEVDSTKPFWVAVTFADTFWIHLARILVYGVGGVIFVAGCIIGVLAIIMVLVIPADTIRNRKEKQHRRDQIAAFRPNQQLGWEERALSTIYVEHGESGLQAVKRTIEQAEKRCQLITEFQPINKAQKFDEIIERWVPLTDRWILGKLEDTGIVKFNGILPTLPKNLIQSLDDMAGHLGINLVTKSEEQMQRTKD